MSIYKIASKVIAEIRFSEICTDNEKDDHLKAKNAENLQFAIDRCRNEHGVICPDEYDSIKILSAISDVIDVDKLFVNDIIKRVDVHHEEPDSFIFNFKMGDNTSKRIRIESIFLDKINPTISPAMFMNLHFNDIVQLLKNMGYSVEEVS